MFRSLLVVAFLLSSACTNEVAPEAEPFDPEVDAEKADGIATPIATLIDALDDHVTFDRSRVDSHCWTGTEAGDLQFTLLTQPGKREAVLVVTPVGRIGGGRLVFTDAYEPDIWRQSAGVTFQLGGASYAYSNQFDEGTLTLPDGRAIPLRCLDPETEL